MTSDNLAALVERAFNNDPPKENEIVYDSTGRYPECVEIAQTFAGRSRDDLSPITLQSEAVALFFFTRAAYVYFLPAFITFCLRQPGEADLVPQFIIDSLEAPARKKGRGAQQSRIEWLTGLQRFALAEVVTHFQRMGLINESGSNFNRCNVVPDSESSLPSK